MATCALCEKKFRDRRGLHGHFRFVHGIEYGSGRPAKKTALTEATKRVIERKRKENEFIERIKSGEFELIPRSEIEGNTFKTKDLEIEEERHEPQDRLKGFEGLRKALEKWDRHEPQDQLKGFEGLKKGLKRWK